MVSVPALRIPAPLLVLPLPVRPRVIVRSRMVTVVFVAMLRQRAVFWPSTAKLSPMISNSPSKLLMVVVEAVSKTSAVRVMLCWPAPAALNWTMALFSAASSLTDRSIANAGIENAITARIVIPATRDLKLRPLPLVAVDKWSPPAGWRFVLET